MKKQQSNSVNKLTLKKVNITKLNNLKSIYGGNNYTSGTGNDTWQRTKDTNDGSGNDTWNITQ